MITYILVALVACVLLICVWILSKLFKQGGTGEAAELRYALESYKGEFLRLDTNIKNEFSNNRSESSQSLKGLREEMTTSLKSFGNVISDSLKNINDVQQNQLASF